LDQICLTLDISNAVINIDSGRKGFATRGKAEEDGRISYKKGIAKALSVFQEAQATTDPYTIILAEYIFLSQELEFCNEADKDTSRIPTQALLSFDDAFLALKVVEGTDYKEAEKIYPHSGKYRFSCFPKDAFLTACVKHKTRPQNILRTPLGLDPMEKALLKQRLPNLSVAQGIYVKKAEKGLF